MLFRSGTNKSENGVYSRYDLSLVEVNNREEADQKSQDTHFKAKDGSHHYYGNIVNVTDTDTDLLGEASDYQIFLYRNNLYKESNNTGAKYIKVFSSIALHEMGHILGGNDDDNNSVMNYNRTTMTTNLSGNKTINNTYSTYSKNFTNTILTRINKVGLWQKE